MSIIQHLTLKQNVDDAIDEISLDRKNQSNDFNDFNLTTIIRIILNTKAVNDNHVIAKTYVDQFHIDKKRFRRDLAKDVYDQSARLVKNSQDDNFEDNH